MAKKLQSNHQNLVLGYTLVLSSFCLYLEHLPIDRLNKATSCCYRSCKLTLEHPITLPNTDCLAPDVISPRVGYHSTYSKEPWSYPTSIPLRTSASSPSQPVQHATNT